LKRGDARSFARSEFVHVDEIDDDHSHPGIIV